MRKVFAVFVMLALISIAYTSRPDPQIGPNIIFISVDTLRADRIGADRQGVSLTPKLDKLAQVSMVFDDHITPIALTLPSHTTMMTGLHPIEHGSLRNSRRIADDIRTLAQELSDRGYETSGFASSRVIDEDTGFDRGFRQYHAGMFQTADITVDLALKWLDDSSREPFFLFLHLWDPHQPYDPPAEHRIFGEADEGLYDGEVSFTDMELDRFLNQLESKGLYEDSLIILTSDHGESLGEKDGYFGHDRCVHEACIRVPLIIKEPDQGKQDRVGTQTSHEGIYDSILSGICKDCSFDWIHLRTDIAIIITRWDTDPTNGRYRTLAVRDGKRKLVIGPNSSVMYDLASGDQIPSSDDNGRELQRSLDIWMADHQEGEEGGRLSDSALDALRSMGYV